VIWLALAVVVAVSYAAQGLCSKRLLDDYPDAWVRWLLFVVATPLLLVYLAVRGIPEVRPAFWAILAISGLGGVVSFWLFMRSLRLTDLSIAYPLISLTPLVMVPVEFVLLGDLPGGRGMLGVVAIVAGVYVLNLSSGRTAPLDPLRAVLRDRGALLALALAAVWAVTGVIDKIAIQHSSPAFYAPLMSATIGLLFAPAAWRARRASAISDTADGDTNEPDPTRFPTRTSRSSLLLFLLQGLFFAVMVVAQYEAIRLTLVSYVISIKRTGTLLGVVFGVLFLGERELGFRLTGAAVIVAGILLLALG
jgi:uncharacterized membrane protein